MSNAYLLVSEASLYQKSYQSLIYNILGRMATTNVLTNYQKYLIDNKKEIHEEFMKRIEFRRSEEIRILEEFPEISTIDKYRILYVRGFANFNKHM